VPDDIPARKEVYWRAEALPILEVQTRPRVSRLAQFSIGILLFGAVASLAVYTQRTPTLRAGAYLLSTIVLAVQKSVAPPSVPDPVEQTSERANVAPASSSSLPFPLPTNYGVYVLSNAALSQLQFLPEQVPDMRVAISTPIKQPSRTTLPDGKAKFIVFRRDLAGNAPDQIEVRVVAWVARALTFDAKAKPSFSPVSDAWNIRNIS
jgi:hypothetical protein